MIKGKTYPFLITVNATLSDRVRTEISGEVHFLLVSYHFRLFLFKGLLFSASDMSRWLETKGIPSFIYNIV